MPQPSYTFQDVYALASSVRKKYSGYASAATREHLQDSTWILNNMDSLPPADIALLAEYNRNVREHIVQRLRQIYAAIVSC